VAWDVVNRPANTCCRSRAVAILPSSCFFSSTSRSAAARSASGSFAIANGSGLPPGVKGRRSDESATVFQSLSTSAAPASATVDGVSETSMR